MKTITNDHSIILKIDPASVAKHDVLLKEASVTSLTDIIEFAKIAVDNVYMGGDDEEAREYVERMAEAAAWLASKAIEFEAKIEAGIEYRKQQTEHVFEAWADEADLEATEPLEDEDEDNYDPDNYWENDLIDWTVEDEEA